MTMPNQRTQALISVRNFLYRLSSPYVPDGLKKVPGPVRAEARRLLKHYPAPGDVLRLEQWDEATVDAYYKELAKEWGYVSDDTVPSDECCS